MKRISPLLALAAVVALVCIPILAEQPPAEEKAEAVKDVPKYVGDKKCKLCHKKVYQAWEKTPHSGAFQSMLDSVGVDTTCLSCHAVGYKQPGGFVDTTSTAYLKNVQCENCHGPGSKYMKLPIMKDREKALANGMVMPDEAVCKSCHSKERSPGFDFEEAKKIGTHVAAEAEKE
ncbi:MAG: multiheme c-type cytochrome [bacterium]